MVSAFMKLTLTKGVEGPLSKTMYDKEDHTQLFNLMLGIYLKILLRRIVLSIFYFCFRSGYKTREGKRKAATADIWNNVNTG